MLGIVEIVAFTAKAGSSNTMLAQRPAAIEAIRAAAPGLKSATLVELGGDEWLDIMVWETREQAEAAEEIASATPEFANWGMAHVAAIGPRYIGRARSSADE